MQRNIYYKQGLGNSHTYTKQDNNITRTISALKRMKWNSTSRSSQLQGVQANHKTHKLIRVLVVTKMKNKTKEQQEQQQLYKVTN